MELTFNESYYCEYRSVSLSILCSKQQRVSVDVDGCRIRRVHTQLQLILGVESGLNKRRRTHNAHVMPVEFITSFVEASWSLMPNARQNRLRKNVIGFESFSIIIGTFSLIPSLQTKINC